VPLLPRTRPARIAVALAVAATTIAAITAAHAARTGRTRAPRAARAAALAAFQKASSGPARAWAAPQLEEARRALVSALVRYSRQEGRPAPWRDHRPVASALDRAASLAREAARAGEVGRARSAADAEAALSRAREIARHARALAGATALPLVERVRLQRAQLGLREAEGLLRIGEPDAARTAAERSAAELGAALAPTLAAVERYRSPAQVATWRRWIEETRAHSRSTGQPAIVVVKERGVLVLLAKGLPARTYGVEIGGNAIGVKLRQGDRATPEGRYRILAKKDRGASLYHRALLLDFPNAADRARLAAAQRRGEVPKGASPGGLIEIHGEGGRGRNWTDGCVALANRDMDDLFHRVSVGTRVTIVGGDGLGGGFSDLLAGVPLPAAGGPAARDPR
jgi:hypothetical protein